MAKYIDHCPPDYRRLYPTKALGRFVKNFARHKYVYIGGIVVPLSIFGIFAGYPLLYNLLLSFTGWNGLAPSIRAVGIRNYVELLADPIFRLALTNTAKWTILTLFLVLTLGLILSIVLSLGKVYLPAFFRSLLFLPVTMSLVSIGIMFSLILSPDVGLLDQFLRILHMGGLIRPWLGGYHSALYTLIAVGAWTYTGIPLMLFHAGISEINPELFNAARLDGASDFQIARYIILPALKPVIVVVSILSVIQSLKTFDLVAIMTQGGPASATKVLGYFMYTETFWNNRFGYGAAISVIIFALSSGFAVIYLYGVAKNALHVSKQ